MIKKTQLQPERPVPGTLSELEKWATEYLKANPPHKPSRDDEQWWREFRKAERAQANEQAERKQSKRDRALASKLLKIENLIRRAGGSIDTGVALLDEAWEAVDDLRTEMIKEAR